MEISNPYSVSGDARVAALTSLSERGAFIKRTYLHLGGAIIAFVLLEAILLNVLGDQVLGMFGGNRWMPLVFLAAFMGVSWLARMWAESDTSPQLQYAGLGLYVLAEAVIFLPLMAMANMVSPDGNIPLNAGIITGVVFLGLTAMTFVTGADFSWMGRILCLAGFAALGAVLCGVVFGFSLGLWFSVAMVVLAAGYILYDTSNVLHHYRTNQHVAASLALFASVALMLWYVVRILMAFRDE